MGTDEATALAAMMVRLQNVEDRLAILQIEGAYSTAYDGVRGDQWAALFTDDGIYQGRQLEGMGELNFVQGKRALTDFCNSNRLSCIHQLGVPEISLDGDDAFSRVNFTFRGFETGRVPMVQKTEAQGYYDVAYRRTANGWRIRRRFTVYFERSRVTTYGYEPSLSPFGAENPPFDDSLPYKDRR
ncbi:nuclear transport factor 2 family protein [Mesorhizobium sp. M7A.F.Ca.US.006.01.1.1]|uniref:nuclear transport factor 2 family protein n=1 Tax=Mesorhizobium sp. M7A.F.Ca.US.006.01.1.1 TaxID=2496707 RepID=UPI0013E36598|nr:nuclear transport factor 2 family protein [Mesorhizobium sp. M7A.F.Ca.US.006.01.1.1]